MTMEIVEVDIEDKKRVRNRSRSKLVYAGGL